MQGPRLTQRAPLSPPSGASVQSTSHRALHDSAGLAGLTHDREALGRDPTPGLGIGRTLASPTVSLYFYPCLLLPFSLPFLPAPGIQGLQITRAWAGEAGRGQSFPLLREGAEDTQHILSILPLLSAPRKLCVCHLWWRAFIEHLLDVFWAPGQSLSSLRQPGSPCTCQKPVLAGVTGERICCKHLWLLLESLKAWRPAGDHTL